MHTAKIIVPQYQAKMGSLPGSCSHFSAREPLHVPLSVMKSCVSRVTEDPRGLAEATDPKERRWDCWRQKCSLVGDQEEIISVNEDTVCVERYPSFYSVIMLVNNWKNCCDTVQLTKFWSLVIHHECSCSGGCWN